MSALIEEQRGSCFAFPHPLEKCGNAKHDPLGTVGTVIPWRDQEFVYDAAGNLLGDGEWTYQYDAMNRLRVMERDSISGLPSSEDLRLEFRYDERNRRIEKTVKERPSGSVIKRERYLYFDWNLVATLEVIGEGGGQTATLKSRYVWRTGNRDTGSMGLLLIAGDHDGKAGTDRRAFIPGYDGRGNLTSLADNLQGVAATGYEYSPFGEVLRAQGSPLLPDVDALGACFGFATQYTDAESGLIYFGHRYYHPGLGRFLSKDPLKEGGGANLYAYANNDPVNMTDYRGLCPEELSSGLWDSFVNGYSDRFSQLRAGPSMLDALAASEAEAKFAKEQAIIKDLSDFEIKLKEAGNLQFQANPLNLTFGISPSSIDLPTFSDPIFNGVMVELPGPAENSNVDGYGREELVLGGQTPGGRWVTDAEGQKTYEMNPFVVAGVAATGVLVADDATVVGVADDLLIPVVWAGVGVAVLVDWVFFSEKQDPLASAGGGEHTSKARPSTKGKHEAGDARKGRDRGGEKGDERRRPPRRKPDGWKGPWPPSP